MTRPNRLTVPVCNPESLKPDLDEVGLVSAPEKIFDAVKFCLLYTSPSPRD